MKRTDFVEYALKEGLSVEEIEEIADDQIVDETKWESVVLDKMAEKVFS